jgi:drug/metabolite transporter, DME family
MHRTASSGYLLVSCAALLWASSGVASRYAPPGLSAATIADMRMSIGGVALALALGPRRVMHAITALGALARRDVLCASAAMALFQWGFFAAVALTGVTVTTVVSTATAPLAAGALVALSRRDYPTPRWWLALVLATAGVTFMLDSGAPSQLAGIGLAAAVGVCYAVFTQASARIAQRADDSQHGGLVAMTVALLFSALALAPAGASGAGGLLTCRGAAIVVYLGIATTAIAYACYAAGLREISPASALALQLLQPAATAVMGFVLLDEQFARSDVAGFALFAASAAIILATPSRARNRPQSPT